MEKVKKELESLKKNIVSNEAIAQEPEAQELLHNIDPILGNPGELSFEYHRALVKSLEKGIEKFEVNHPRLVDDIRIIVNSLNDIGI